MSSIESSLKFGCIKSADPYSNFVYQITQEDVLWAAKFLYAESKKDLLQGACFLWCMTNKIYVSRNKYFWPKKSFAEMIRKFSNWTRADYRKKKVRTLKQETIFNKQRRIERMTIDDLPISIVKLVEMWATGNLPNPIENAYICDTPKGASFQKGSSGIISRGLEVVYDKYNRGTNSLSKDGVVFYTTKVTQKWKENMVFIELDDRKTFWTTREKVEILISQYLDQ